MMDTTSSVSPEDSSPLTGDDTTIRLVLHRRDLRLLDNPLYSNLTSSSNTQLISLYVFDEKSFLPQPSTCCPDKWDVVSTGPHASRLLIEAVTELRRSLRNIGGELLVRKGDPTKIVPEIASQIGATEVYWNEEPGAYETSISNSIKNHFLLHCNDNVKIVTNVGCCLYHPNDLPTDPNAWAQLAHPKQKHKNRKMKKMAPLSMNAPGSPPFDMVDVSSDRFKGMCRIMGDFRKAARTSTSVRSTIPAPTSLTRPDSSNHILAGVIPTLDDLVAPLLLHQSRPILGLSDETIDLVIASAQRRAGSINEKNDGTNTSEEVPRGGESWAMQRLDDFVSGGHAARAIRNLADVSDNNSSKLSVHLALGTISPRTIYESAKDAGEGCEWLTSHLEMRDFFIYLAWALDSTLFRKEGMPVVAKRERTNWRHPASDAETLKSWIRWATGHTNLPLVDAAMTELITTGYCSNRVRQNAASILTKDLEIDWRAGADLFQFLLEDHCVAANWGNWQYFSGVGSDPKNRHFRTISQALRYDPEGLYVMKWLPVLCNIGNEEGLFRPWIFSSYWSDPLVDPKTQLTWDDLKRLDDRGCLLETEDKK